eukprot:11436426-Ditylum_brightwellii.AAC.1
MEMDISVGVSCLVAIHALPPSHVQYTSHQYVLSNESSPHVPKMSFSQWLERRIAHPGCSKYSPRHQ